MKPKKKNEILREKARWTIQIKITFLGRKNVVAIRKAVQLGISFTVISHIDLIEQRMNENI